MTRFRLILIALLAWSSVAFVGIRPAVADPTLFAQVTLNGLRLLSPRLDAMFWTTHRSDYDGNGVVDVEDDRAVGRCWP